MSRGKNRLQKILFGSNVEPQTPLETAVKYAVTQSGSLPPVTETDNGKVFGVDQGEWGLVFPKYPVYVEFVCEEDPETHEISISTDADYEEVCSLHDDHITIIADISIPNGVHLYVTLKQVVGGALVFHDLITLSETWESPMLALVIFTEDGPVLQFIPFAQS